MVDVWLRTAEGETRRRPQLVDLQDEPACHAVLLHPPSLTRLGADFLAGRAPHCGPAGLVAPAGPWVLLSRCSYGAGRTCGAHARPLARRGVQRPRSRGVAADPEPSCWQVAVGAIGLFGCWIGGFVRENVDGFDSVLDFANLLDLRLASSTEFAIA